MASERGYRDKWLRYHTRYENKADRIFRGVFQSWGKSINLDELNVINYPEVVKASIDTEQLRSAYLEVYEAIGLMHGRRVGNAFNKDARESKFFIFGDFETALQQFIRTYINQIAFEYFKTVEQTYYNSIVKVIGQMVSEGQSTEDITTQLRKIVRRRSFYRWQARRIARTEATAAANIGAMQAGQISGFVTNKVWISSNDQRTRRIPEDQFDHYVMNGVEVGLNEFFQVPTTTNVKGYENMRYPGDRGGIGNNTTSAGNTINCRCTVAVIAARDEDGNLIREL